jgi:hypothetical protein
MEQTECSETLEYKIQTPGNYPEENIQHIQNTAKDLIQEYFSFISTRTCYTTLATEGILILKKIKTKQTYHL